MSGGGSSWIAAGDVNAFFGLMLDNVADLLLMVSLLGVSCGFPAEFALRYMVPGTAIGVLVGDLLFFLLALWVIKKTGRKDVTAMPLGLDTPSTFGMVFFVLAPTYREALQTFQGDVTQAATLTWHVGACAIFVSGLFKTACAFGSNWIRRTIPRAGLLGSLASIALVVISFIPLLEVLHYPIVGLVALAIVLTTLVAKVSFPGRIPGALAALLVAGLMYYVIGAIEFYSGSHGEGQTLLQHFASRSATGIDPAQALMPTEWLAAFKFEWIRALDKTLPYLPVVLPLALGTVVGGIDCTESAAAVGDEYDTGVVIGIEAIATIIAGLCGGVIQTTPYIGHPAYKAMGGRAAYTLATALFIGTAGLLGYFGYMYLIIPKAAVFPILVFVGIEITSQSFFATPKRHYPAVAFACVPALAALVMIEISKFQPDESAIPAFAQAEFMTLRILQNGFVITSLVWASLLAAMIDRRLLRAACWCFVAAVFTFFGIMHSPTANGTVFLPFDVPGVGSQWILASDLRGWTYQYAGGYLIVAGMLWVWNYLLGETPPPIETEKE